MVIVDFLCPPIHYQLEAISLAVTEGIAMHIWLEIKHRRIGEGINSANVDSCRTADLWGEKTELLLAFLYRAATLYFADGNFGSYIVF